MKLWQAVLFSLFLGTVLQNCTAARKRTSSPEKAASSAHLRKNVVAYAQKFKGTPYKYAGKSPKTGFDCSGFTSFVFNEFDIRVSPSSSEQALQGKPVPLSKVQPGDIVVFGKNRKKIQHVALVVSRKKDGVYCIHSTNRGVVVDNISESSYWKPLILEARDVIGR